MLAKTMGLSRRASGRSTARFRCAPGRIPWRGGAGGAFETIRGGSVSKSVAKAPRDGIGREKKRGISTILFRRSGPIRAFATDLDNCATRAPRRGAAAAWTATMTSTPTAGWARGNAARPRARHLTREHVPLADVLAGQVTCSAVTRRSRGPRRRPTRPPGRPGAEIWTPRRRNVHFALESAVPTVALECEMHVSARKARCAPAPSLPLPAPLTPRPRQPLRPAGV